MEKTQRELAVAVLIAHYSSVREDILSKVAMRDRYVYLCVLGSGLVFYFQLTAQTRDPILFLIPLLIVITSILFAQVDRIIGMMAKWLKENYGREVALYTGHAVDHWDASNIGDHLIKSSVFQARYLSMGAIFVVIGYTALANRIGIAAGDGLFAALRAGPSASEGWRWVPYYMGARPFELAELLVFLCSPVLAYVIVTSSGRARAAFHENHDPELLGFADEADPKTPAPALPGGRP